MIVYTNSRSRNVCSFLIWKMRKTRIFFCHPHIKKASNALGTWLVDISIIIFVPNYKVSNPLAAIFSRHLIKVRTVQNSKKKSFAHFIIFLWKRLRELSTAGVCLFFPARISETENPNAQNLVSGISEV